MSVIQVALGPKRKFLALAMYISFFFWNSSALGPVFQWNMGLNLPEKKREESWILSVKGQGGYTVLPSMHVKPCIEVPFFFLFLKINILFVNIFMITPFLPNVTDLRQDNCFT